MGDIAAASEQQQQGVGQLNSAVAQLNQVTQQTAASAEEAASTAGELSGQAAEMQHLVKTFTLSLDITAAPQTPAPRPPRRLAAVVTGPARADAAGGNGHAAPARSEEVIVFDDDIQQLRKF
jgi:methyl-accepting chemotaxis protein